jgi:polyhydroxyalkanoate synthesis regulator phasin
VTPDGAGLSLSEHCALLFAAVKAQQEEIEALKTRITKLENQ